MEVKTVISVPWANTEYQWKQGAVNTEAEAYSVPLIYRATRLRCNSLTRVPRYIYNESDDEVDYVFETQLPIRQLLWLCEASMLLKGTAYLLKLKNRFRYGKGLQWLNPFTIQTKYEKGELLFWQQLPTGERYPAGGGFWTVDDFLYFREFNPADDIGAGVGATSVAMMAAKSSANVSTFLSNFFGADALPVTMVMLPAGVSDTERDRLELWFKTKIRNMRNAVARVLGVKGDFKLEKLTSELKTFDFPSVDEHTLEQVALAFDLPKTMLSTESANYATAHIERRIYMEDTIVPRCDMYEEMLNPFLEESGQRLEFAPQELPEMQDDETVRATSLKGLVDAGIPLLAAIDILGYDLSDDAEKLIEESEKKKEETEKKREEAANKPPVVVAQQQPPQEPVKADLDKWMRKALNNMKAKNSAAVEFESNYIPNEMKSDILIGLKEAQSEDEVRNLFKRQLNDSL